jgi:hypothetical protein
MTDLFSGDRIPTGEKVRELQREIRTRQFVYANQIAAKKLDPDVAARRIAILEAVVEDYQLGRVGK